MTANKLIDDYLERLATAARNLPSPQRDELLTEISAHIDVTLAAGQGRSEAMIRTVLDRLGDPEEIVQAASDHGATATAATAQPRPARKGHEPLGGRRALAMVLIAVTLAAAGIVLPLAGWAVGAIVAWFLIRWPTRYKVLTTIVWPLGFGLGAWLLGPGASGSSQCSSDGRCTSDGMPIGIQMALGFAGVLAAAALTFLVLRRERQAVT